MEIEIKTALEELQKTVIEFRAANDQRLAEVEKKGIADPTLVSKVEKLNAKLDTYETLNKKLTEDFEAAKKRADELETKFNRIGIPGGASGTGATTVTDREFKFLQRYYQQVTPQKRVVADAAEVKAMRDAFFQFCVGGRESMSPEEIKALVVADDTAGGYLSPPEYVREIIKAVVLISPMRGLVRMRNTVQQAIQIPKRTSVSTATWVAESATRTESTNPAYGLVTIPTYELTAEHYISMQELEDAAFDMEAELSTEFAEQFAKAEGAAFVSGNGVGKPRGFLDSTVGLAYTPSGTSDKIEDANGQANGIITLCYALKTAYAQNATWVLNRQTLGGVRMLKDTHMNYIWQPGIAAGQPNTILGYPYAEMPDMPAIGSNAFPIAFGDWKRAYVGVDRIAMSVLRDPYTRASSGQVKFVARRRVGGDVALAEAIRVLKCATT